MSDRIKELELVENVMDLEIINKLFLELSQIATATTAKEVRLLELLKESNECLRSAFSIADRKGESVNWEAFRNRLRTILEKQHPILFVSVDSHK